MADETAGTDTGTVSSGTGSPSSGSSSTGSGASSTPPTTAHAALARAAAAQTAAPPAGVQGQAGAGANGTPSGQTAATTQAPPSSTAPSEGKRGPIPFDAHEQALKNARTKAAEEALQPFGWAKDLKQADVQRAMKIIGMMDGDPRAFMAQLSSELAEQNEDIPQPDYTSPDGKAQFYSAQAMTKALTALENKLRRELMGQVQPLLSEREQAQQRAQQQQAQQAMQTEIREAISHMETLPFYSKENEKFISEEMEKIPRQAVQRMGIVGAMYLAYSNFVAKHQSRLTEEARNGVHADLQRKAAAAGGQVSPQGGNPNPPTKRPTNQRELAAHMERIAGGNQS